MLYSRSPELTHLLNGNFVPVDLNLTFTWVCCPGLWNPSDLLCSSLGSQSQSPHIPCPVPALSPHLQPAGSWPRKYVYI